ncbi:hypothetical protein [Ochrobactrum sp. EDr1-4]|uniref:hypothetical protein n=1 Tax=Ochrobactrum sp. EDr1-4 TaxID=3368622 RepID=UPI003B9F97E0
MNNLIEHISVPINRAPQQPFLAIDPNNDFIEMPDITRRGWLATQLRSEQKAMRPAPYTDAS